MRSGIEVQIEHWQRQIEFAATQAIGDLWLRIGLPEDEHLPPACSSLIAWTVIGMVQLCGGPGLVRAPPGWVGPEDWQIWHSRVDDCAFAAANNCLGVLARYISAGVDDVGTEFDWMPAACPGGLPFAPPCNVGDRHACLKERFENVLRAFLAPER